MVDQRFDHIDSGKFSLSASAGVLAAPVGHLHPVAVHPAEGPLPHPVHFATQERGQRGAVLDAPRHDAEDVGNGGVQVNIGGERAAHAAGDAGPVHQERRVAERLVLHHAGLAPDVLLPQIVTVIGADDDRRALPQAAFGKSVEDLAHPVIDHGELGSVVGPDLVPLALAQSAGRDCARRHTAAR